MTQQLCPICKQGGSTKEDIKHKNTCSEYKYQQKQIKEEKKEQEKLGSISVLLTN